MKLKLPATDDGRHWPLWASFGAVSGLLVLVYGFRLARLVPASGAEQAVMQTLAGAGATGHSALPPLYQFLAWLAVHLPLGNLLNLRSLSAAYALASAWLFYCLARRWHGRLVGVAATVLFALSGWMLGTGRMGIPFISLSFAVLALLNATALASKAEGRPQAGKAVCLWAAACANALATPGGVWFAIAGGIVAGGRLYAAWKAAGGLARVAGGLLAAAGLALLAWQCQGYWHQALAVPGALPGLRQLAGQFFLATAGIVVRGPDLPALWLGRTPLLDIASGTLLLLGIILYAKHPGNGRTRLLLAFAGVGIALTALNGPAGLSYLLPVCYLVIASGAAYFRHQWHKVFPRNPVADFISLASLAAVLVAVVVFHIQRYYIAWPNSPTTAQAYRQAGPAANGGRQDQPYLVQ